MNLMILMIFIIPFVPILYLHFVFVFFPKTEFHSIFPTFQPYFHSFQYFPMIFMIFYQHFPSFPSFPKLSVIFLGCFPSFFQRFIAIAGPPPRSSRLQRRELAQKGLAQLRGAAKLAVEGGAKQTRWGQVGIECDHSHIVMGV
jgi:hypothetical protein